MVCGSQDLSSAPYYELSTILSGKRQLKFVKLVSAKTLTNYI